VVAEKVRQLLREEKEQKDKAYIGLQIHAYYDILKEAFPKAKYIHLVRDPRPVCKSKIARGWHGNCYSAAKNWVNGIRSVKKLQKEIPKENFLEIKYEDMVSRVKETLSLICSFIGVSYTDKMLDFTRNSTYSYPNPDNINSWRHSMKREDSYYVESISREFMEDYGYVPLWPQTNRPRHLKKVYLYINDKINVILFKIRCYGLKDYIMVSINKLLKYRIFVKAEENIVQKNINRLK